MTAYGMPRQISVSTSSEGDSNPDTNDTTAETVNNTATVTANNPILTSTAGSRRAKAPTSSPAVIGLQYGSNRVASQSGMTAYGMPRQIIPSTSSVTSVEGPEEEREGNGEKGDVFVGENKT